MKSLILVSIFVSLFFVSSFVGLGYGLEENETEWIPYTDPEGKFSLEYPADWNAKERENRFSTTDLILSSPLYDEDGTLMGIDLQDYKISSVNVTKDLAALMKIYQDKNIFTPDFKIVEEKLGKYNIDGNAAIYYIASFSNDGKEIGTFTLLSYLDEGVFDITYFSPTDNFDKYFPIVERLIKSVKISSQV